MSVMTTGMMERAGLAKSASDREIRYRCRTAPQHVRANIDAHREARGLPRLWSSAATGSAARATVRRLKAFLAVARLRAS
jgi:hypothetical protein